MTPPTAWPGIWALLHVPACAPGLSCDTIMHLPPCALKCAQHTAPGPSALPVPNALLCAVLAAQRTALPLQLHRSRGSSMLSATAPELLLQLHTSTGPGEPHAPQPQLQSSREAQSNGQAKSGQVPSTSHARRPLPQPECTLPCKAMLRCAACAHICTAKHSQSMPLPTIHAAICTTWGCQDAPRQMHTQYAVTPRLTKPFPLLTGHSRMTTTAVMICHQPRAPVLWRATRQEGKGTSKEEDRKGPNQPYFSAVTRAHARALGRGFFFSPLRNKAHARVTVACSPQGCTTCVR